MSSKWLIALLLLFMEGCGDRTRDANEVKDAQQPGIVRFSKIGSSDTIQLDGEEVPWEGLARSNRELLLAPGSYTLKITMADGTTCESRLSVRSGGVSVPEPCRADSKPTQKF